MPDFASLDMVSFEAMRKDMPHENRTQNYWLAPHAVQVALVRRLPVSPNGLFRVYVPLYSEEAPCCAVVMMSYMAISFSGRSFDPREWTLSYLVPPPLPPLSRAVPTVARLVLYGCCSTRAEQPAGHFAAGPGGVHYTEWQRVWIYNRGDYVGV